MPKRRTQKKPLFGNFQKRGNKYLSVIKSMLNRQRGNTERVYLNYTSRKLRLNRGSRKRRK